MSQARMDDPGKFKSEPVEPWPEEPEGHYGPRARVSALRPPPLIEETVSGVIVSPPESESLRFVFDSQGRLVNYWEFPFELIINAIPDTVHYIAFVHAVKVLGSVETHIAICLLLRMLKRKYMKNLRGDDETRFWNTWDIAKLGRRHAEMGALIGLVGRSIESGGLLSELGAEIGGDGKIRLLDPDLSAPAPKAKAAATKRKPRVN